MDSIKFINKTSMVETCGAPYGIFHKYICSGEYLLYVKVAGIKEKLIITDEAYEEEVPLFINEINKKIDSGEKVIDCDMIKEEIEKYSKDDSGFLTGYEFFL